MKHLIFIRHSMVTIDPSQPSHSWGLSELGKDRVISLSSQLKSWEIEKVYTSEEQKATQTADILSRGLNLDRYSPLPGLQEHNRSNVGFHHDLIERMEHIRQYFQNPTQLVYGSETADNANVRFAAAVHAILDKNKDATVAVVSHGTVMAGFIANIISANPFSLWCEFQEMGMPFYVALDRETYGIAEIGQLD